MSLFIRLLLVLAFSCASAAAQSLADVLSSIQERQRAVEQSRQVSLHLRNLGGASLTIPNQYLIAWTGLGAVEFPTEGDLASVGIEGRVALLNQAIAEFERLQRSYLNLRAEDLSSSSHVGALRPFMREDFPDLGRADASNYHDILSRLAHQVLRLRVLPWPVSGLRQYHRYTISKWEEELYDGGGNVIGVEEQSAEGSTPYTGWDLPSSIGPGVADGTPSTFWISTENPTGVISEAVYTYNHFSKRNGEGGYTLRNLLAYMVGNFFQEVRLPSTVPGRSDQIGGMVALLSRSLWTPAGPTDYTAPSTWNNQDGSYTVATAVTNATGSESFSTPSITLNLQWFDVSDDEKRGLPPGFSGYKQYLQGGSYADWTKSWEWFSFDDLRDPIVLHRQLLGVAAPAFARGLNSGSKAAALASSANHARPPSGDAVPELHPVPGILLGVPVGAGLDGNATGWIGWSPGDQLFHLKPVSETPGYIDTVTSTLLYPASVWGGARLIRFDHGANLRFIGPAQDFHVVYENSRTARGAGLPTHVPTTAESENSGWDAESDIYSGPYPPSWKNHFFAAWDAPRLRQVVSRDFIVDVAHNGHYSTEIKVYRRPLSAGAVNRTPGHLETPSPENLLRTLVCSNPAAGGSALPAVAERIEMTDGSVKYEVWRDGLEASYALSTQALRFRVTEDSTVKWSKVIEFPQNLDARITTTLDTAPSLVDDLSGAWPMGDIAGGGRIGWYWWDNRTPLSFKRTSDGKVIEITNTINPSSPGSQRGAWPATSLVKVSGEPDLSLAWKNSGLPHYSERGEWRTDWTILSGTLVETTKLGGENGQAAAISWTDWSEGERKVKTYRSPYGNGTKEASETFWSEVEYGDSTGTGLPGLPHIVRNSDDTGATFEWDWLAPSDVSQLTLTRGLLSGDSVSRGVRVTQGVNKRGFPTETLVHRIAGGTLQIAGNEYGDFNEWGMPRKSTGYNTGRDTTWTYSGKLSLLTGVTSPLGLTTSFTGYDAFGRVGNVSSNGIHAAVTHNGFNRSATVTGTASGSVAFNHDGIGRPTASNITWNGVVDHLGLTYDSGSLGISRTLEPYGVHNAKVRQSDGSLEEADGPTLAFGGTEGGGLSVSNGLLVTHTALADASGTFAEIHTDAWGRVHKIVTPSKSGGGSATTDIEWSDPVSSWQSVVTTEPTGRILITESDPYGASGAINRSGIDVNGDGSLGASDRYTESVTKVEGGKLVTTMKATEDGGLREVLRSEWTPSSGVTVTQVNGNEETITTTPNWLTKTVTTVSSKGWTRTTVLNHLGLPTSNTLSGAGIPTMSLDPVWRADGSLASVSLNIGGETHTAAFNHDGTFSGLTAPDRGGILGGHDISDGVETLTVNGVTVQQTLDGTGLAISGGDAVGRSEILAPSGGGFKHTVTPATGAATETMLNAAMVPTGKSYAFGPGESYVHAGGLPVSVSLARGGSLTLGYSNDGARDLISATWPTVTSGPFTVPGLTQGFSYDRAGRIKTLSDSSGIRSLVYGNGRLVSASYTSGPLQGYEVLPGHDASGRPTGSTLKRSGTVIHSVEKAPNGVSEQVAALVSGGIKVVPQRDGAGRIRGYQWGNAAGAFTPAVTQTWERGPSGRIEEASSNVPGAPSFDYLLDPGNPGESFDALGRRLKCTTAGGTWTYTYGTAGQLASASHTTLGTFAYAFDGIGRRTDKGAANTTDLLNRTLAWSHSQNKTLTIPAHPDARVWLNGVEIPSFTGSYQEAITPPGANGGWVAWDTLAVLEGHGEGAGSPPVNPLASPDAKAKKKGAVWVPPLNENLTYDAAGNRQGNAQWDYGWDGKNQLVRARTKDYATAPQGWDLRFTYDAEGRRIRKQVAEYRDGAKVSEKTITFVWDGWDLLYERHQLSSGLTTLERKYLWGPDIADGAAGGAGGLLLIRETKGSTTTELIPLYDGTGHVVALTNLDQDLLASYAYGPFGERIAATGPKAQDNPWRYATKYLDEETGLYYFGQRYYDPVTGQWLSREPLGESESVNLYAYCHNNPIGAVDVLGLAAKDVRNHVDQAEKQLAQLTLAMASLVGSEDEEFEKLCEDIERIYGDYLGSVTSGYDELAKFMQEGWFLSFRSADDDLVRDLSALPTSISGMRPDKAMVSQWMQAGAVISDSAAGQSTVLGRTHTALVVTEITGDVVMVSTGLGAGGVAIRKVLIQQGGKQAAKLVARGMAKAGTGLAIGFLSEQAMIKAGVSPEVANMAMKGAELFFAAKMLKVARMAGGVNQTVATIDSGGPALVFEYKAPKTLVPTIGGRVPINSKYAGQIHPTGIRFTEQGFPDFSPIAKAQVRIKGLTGNYAKDAALANQAVGLKATPPGYVWHHVEDGVTMQLVPQSIHTATRHTGGTAVIRNGGFDP